MSSHPNEPVPTEAAARLQPAYLSVDELLEDLEFEVIRGGARLFAGPTLEARPIASEHRKIALAISGPVVCWKRMAKPSAASRSSGGSASMSSRRSTKSIADVSSTAREARATLQL